MICPNCNASLEDNSRFCYNCGATIEYKKEDTAPKKKSLVSMWLAIIFGVLTLVFLGTTILFYVKYSDMNATVDKLEAEIEKLKDKDGDGDDAGNKVSYVERNKRSTDINNAENIRMCILADIADQKYPFTEKGWLIPIEGEYCPTALGEVKTIKNKEHKGEYFLASWDPIMGTCDVYDSTGEYLLTDIKGAEDYENGNPAGKYNSTVTK